MLASNIRTSAKTHFFYMQTTKKQYFITQFISSASCKNYSYIYNIQEAKRLQSVCLPCVTVCIYLQLSLSPKGYYQNFYKNSNKSYP